MDGSPSSSSTNGTTTGHHPPPIPVMSIRREDMPLRRDVVHLLTMAGIDTEHDLLYLDDGIVQSKLLGGGAEDDAHNHNHNHNHNTVTLVDHNKLRSSLWHLEGNVVEIIDHHYDEGFHNTAAAAARSNGDGAPTTPNPNNRDIAFADQTALVGSTCTLVTERLMKLYDHHHAAAATTGTTTTTTTTTREVDPSLGLALLGVI